MSLGVSLDSRKTCEVLRSYSPEALLSRGPEMTYLLGPHFDPAHLFMKN